MESEFLDTERYSYFLKPLQEPNTTSYMTRSFRLIPTHYHKIFQARDDTPIFSDLGPRVRRTIVVYVSC
jgi:hypothetical protein